MERILLVEPNYKNKYPPIGLMKLSTYFKSIGNFVVFHKGLLPVNETSTYDKIYITTLFTFDFNMCVDTIRYYVSIAGIQNVFVGGVVATIMPERFRTAIPGIQLLECQVSSSSMLGYKDEVNIDNLDLDYDILWDIAYRYPTENSYFIYTTRGCHRGCSFCAVNKLEPEFLECQNIYEQITKVDECFGQKKLLLIMDNNILYSENLSSTVRELVGLGFGSDNNTARKNNNMPYYLQSLWKRIELGKQYTHLLNRVKEDFLNVNPIRVSSSDSGKLLQVLECIKAKDDVELIEILREKQPYIEDFFYRYNYHKIKRYVDFNQGLDARLFTKEKAELLAMLAVKPCRIALDSMDTEKEYLKALNYAVDSGIQHFSNYLLYNYDETPEDLWKRMLLNVDYSEDHEEVLSLFSFPMKYASVERIDRNYIGMHWNKKYLKSMNVILNATSGVVAGEKSFFVRAYGRNEEEFLEILTMPDDFIRYRDFFEKNRMIQQWSILYRALKSSEKQELLKLLSNTKTETDVPTLPHSTGLNRIIEFYDIKKSRVEENTEYYLRNCGVEVELLKK